MLTTTTNSCSYISYTYIFLNTFWRRRIMIKNGCDEKKQQWQQPVAAMQLFFCIYFLSLLSFTFQFLCSLSLAHSFKFFGNFCRWEWSNVCIRCGFIFLHQQLQSSSYTKGREREDKNSRMLKSYFLLNNFFCSSSSSSSSCADCSLSL